MIALFSFLIIIFLSLFVVRIGAIALEATGISSDVSKFEALSAFSGVGFTTKESEIIMGNTLRRQIVKILMISGSAGLTTGVATLILTFLTAEGDPTLYAYKIGPFAFSALIIILGSFFLFLVSKTELFDKLVRWLIKGAIKKIKKRVSMYDYESLLGMSRGYGVIRFHVPKRNWMVNKTIGTLKLEKEGVVALGLFRDIHGHEEYIGLPSNDFKIHANDKIVIYCKENMMENLSKREKGKQGKLSRKEAELQHKKLNLINELDEQKFKIAHKNKEK